MLPKKLDMNSEETKMKKYILSVILIAFAIVVTACGGKDGGDEKTIKVGTSPGPYSELFLNGIKPILEKQGYTIEATDFTDLRQADIALADDGVHLNVDQHTAYMHNFNTESGSELVAITPIPTVPAALFPGKKKSLDAVEEGDVIGIPQDPSNSARAYAILQKAGWITLKEGVEPIKATAADIAENPLKLEIIEMDSAQIPRTLLELDYGIIPGSMVYASGTDPNLALLPEDVVKQYELVAVVNKGNEDSEWAKAVVEAYRSDDFKKFLEEENNNGYWFVPEELK